MYCEKDMEEAKERQDEIEKHKKAFFKSGKKIKKIEGFIQSPCKKISTMLGTFIHD